MDKEQSIRSLAPIIENQSTEYNGTNTEDDEKSTADKKIKYHKTVTAFHTYNVSITKNIKGGWRYV